MEARNMDSFQALGLCEEALHFDVEVTFPDNQTKIFDITTRDTVDKVKFIAFSHFNNGHNLVLDDYLLGVSEKEKLEVEFVKFILAHAKIREDLESGELVKVGLFKKGVITDTTAKDKIDLNTDINFEQRRSSVSMSLSKLNVSKRTSGSSTPTQSKSKKDKDKDKDTHAKGLASSLGVAIVPRPTSPSDGKKEKHKRNSSETEEKQASYQPIINSTGRTGSSSNFQKPKIHRTSPSAEEISIPSLTCSAPTTPSSHSSPASPTLSPSSPSSPSNKLIQIPDKMIQLPTLPPNLLPHMDSPKGYLVDSGVARSQIGVSELAITDTLKAEPWYAQYFFGKEHSNYIGNDDLLGVLIISVIQEAHTVGHPMLSLSDGDVPIENGNKESVKVRAIVRTKKGDEKGCTVMKNTGIFKSKKIRTKDIIQHTFPHISTGKLSKNKNPELCLALKGFEERQLIRSYKFGVLYCKAGQAEEEDMFSNKAGSKDFEEFLDTLGERVTLLGWPNYRAGLDVKSGSTGEKSVYVKFKGFEVMYHVATLLPYSNIDMQQLERKRHIGNDIVVIVFKEGGQPFDPNCIKSEFNHIFAVVSKVKKEGDSKTYYRLSIACKEGVPPFKPDLPANAVFEKGDLFREFLLCKLINGENTSYEATSFKIKIQRTRLQLLKDIESRFSS